VRVQQQAVLGEALMLVRGPEGEVRYQGADSHGLRYEAFIAGDREPIMELVPPQERQRYLELPPEMPARIAALAHEWADAQPTPYLKAKALEEHLKRDFKYDTGSPSGGKPQPVDHFLFESKRGHCEFFSTAMAMMLRALGIPSRNVTGFVGGTYNRFGRYYAVREGDAHSWVEGYFDDPIRGWVTFDPTPTSGAQPLQDTSGAYVYMRDLLEALSQRWNRYVIGYDLKTQVRLFEDIGRSYDRLRAKTGTNRGLMERVTRGPVVVGAMLVAFTAGYLVWKRRRRPKADGSEAADGARSDPKQEAATALYRTLELALNTQGIARPTALPPLKHAEELVAKEHPLADDVLALTNRYLEARFGGDALSDDAARDYEKKVREIRAYKAPPPPAAP
jgi:hypothetical protein